MESYSQPSAQTSSSLRRLNKTVLVEILKFLEGKEVFKMGLIMLNKKIYYEMGLTQYMLMRQLGIIEDFDFELGYLSRVTGRSQEELGSLPLSFSSRDQCQLYFQQFSRKKSINLSLFGYQALGGSEVIDGKSKHAKQNSIKHLFIRSEGFYCSSNDCELCVASGVFYREPDYDVSSLEELMEEVKEVEKASLENGYKVLEDFGTLKGFPLEDRSKLLIMAAKYCKFIDARYKRQFIEFYKGGKKPTHLNNLVQFGVLRTLIFNSTSSEDQPGRGKLVKFDISTHQSLSLRSLFSFNGLYFKNAGSFTCPVRSFFLFVHNQEDVDFGEHPLVQLLKKVQRKEELEKLVKEVKSDCKNQFYGILPRLLSESTQKAKQNMDLVEFDHSFYSDAFRSRSLTMEESAVLRLRLCAFIDLHEESGSYIDFRQSYAGRYVSLLFTDRSFRDLGGEGVQGGGLNALNQVENYVNYDVHTVYFKGHVVPSLFSLN